MNGHGQQVCYVIPSLGDSEHQHFAHLPRLITEIGKLTTVHVIAERGNPNTRIKGAAQILVQRNANRSLAQRAIELLRFALTLRSQGCRKFFVRISVPAVLTLGVAAPFLGIKIYYWQSGYVKRTYPQWKESPLKRLKLELALIPQYVALSLVHRFVTGPESMVDYYVRSYHVSRRKCVVIYNDLDLSSWRLCSDNAGLFNSTEPIRMLFVGRLSPLKGGYNLAPILREIQQRQRKVHLRAVGEIHGESLRATLEAPDVRDAVEFIGPVPNCDLGQHYEWAQVCVLPSESEGFPRTLLEIMACGRPFVAYGVGGVRDIVPPEYAGYVITPGDHAAFAAAVLRIVDNPALAATLIAAGSKQVRKYATPAVARMFVERIVAV